MLHHQRVVIATPSNQWHKDLQSVGALRPAYDSESLIKAIYDEWTTPSQFPNNLLLSRAPDVVYKPLLNWLESPSLTHHFLDKTIMEAHQQLLLTHHALLQSPTIRRLNALHKRLKLFFNPPDSPIK